MQTFSSSRWVFWFWTFYLITETGPGCLTFYIGTGIQYTVYKKTILNLKKFWLWLKLRINLTACLNLGGFPQNFNIFKFSNFLNSWKQKLVKKKKKKFLFQQHSCKLVGGAISCHRGWPIRTESVILGRGSSLKTPKTSFKNLFLENLNSLF